MLKGIALESAWLRWGVDRTLKPEIRVIEVGQEIDKRYFMSWGSPNADFRMAEPEQRLTLLFAKAMELVLYHGYDPNIVHCALLPIYEYRACLFDNLVLNDL
ncbi:hypothetical protein [Sphingomonas sp.]|uniref:hypothetical protein n=1 Tax=Sphingomonas sp. TaxID=28214 RepID=UPI003B00C01A